jgi:hypothetical protein
MTNKHRGDISLRINGQELQLRLTLQSLAEIEAALGGHDLSALGARFSSGKVGARDLVTLLGAAARGGGSNLCDAEIAALLPAAEIPIAVEALGRLLELTFGGNSPPNPPVPQDA